MDAQTLPFPFRFKLLHNSKVRMQAAPWYDHAVDRVIDVSLSNASDFSRALQARPLQYHYGSDMCEPRFDNVVSFHSICGSLFSWKLEG